MDYSQFMLVKIGAMLLAADLWFLDKESALQVRDIYANKSLPKGPLVFVKIIFGFSLGLVSI